MYGFWMAITTLQQLASVNVLENEAFMGSIFHIHYYSTHFLIVFLFNVPRFPCVLNLHFQFA